MQFYVTAIEDGVRKYFVAGPFQAHAVALALVGVVRQYARKMDGRAHFMAWGTASVSGMQPRVVLPDLSVLDD